VASDLRYAIRSFAKTPSFTAIALLTIALAIGANTAIFTVVNAVLLRPFPYDEPDTLVRVRRGTSYEDMQDWIRRTASFAAVGAFRPQLFDYNAGSEAQRVDGALVTGGAMSLFGARTLAGRTIQPQDDRSGGERVAAISTSFWRTRLGSDPRIIGRRLTFNGVTYTVIGVMDAAFELPALQADVYTPFLPDAGREASSRGAHTLRAFLRLKPGIPIAQAQAEMNGIAVALERQYPQTNHDVRFVLQRLDDSVVGAIRPALLILLGTVGCVLLIACVNVANLLVARAAARRDEIAIRAAIGATRMRIVRQLLTESVLLAVAGGAAGLMLAAWLTRAIVALAPEGTPRIESASLDLRVLAFTTIASVFTGLLFGLAPAWSSSRTSVADVSRAGTRSTSRGRGRRVLMVLETALALVLLVGAGLLLRSFVALASQPTGFDPGHLLTANITLSGERYADIAARVRVFQDFESRVTTLPGVRAIALTTDLPIGGNPAYHNLSFEGRNVAPGTEPEVYYRAVNPGYFEALRIPLLKGRRFEDQDRAGAPLVAIVNESFARTYYPGEEPLGRHVWWTSGDGTPMTIVGVAADVRALSLDQGEVPAVHVPYAQEQFGWRRWMDVAVRVDGEPLAVAAALGAQLRQVDPDVPLAKVASMEGVIGRSMADRRFNLFILGAFAVLALALAAAGTYGVIAYSVVQRTREIGVRVALGATPADVLILVLRDGLLVATGGIALGTAIALVGSSALADMLFGVERTDAFTFGAAAGVLLLASAVATYVPARRAVRVDPLLALRSE